MISSTKKWSGDNMKHDKISFSVSDGEGVERRTVQDKRQVGGIRKLARIAGQLLKMLTCYQFVMADFNDGRYLFLPTAEFVIMEMTKISY